MRDCSLTRFRRVADQRRVSEVGNRKGCMEFRLQLQIELEKIAPEWTWKCETLDDPSCHNQWRGKLRAFGEHKKTGRKTLPVLVNGSLYGHLDTAETANLIYRILERTEPTLAHAAWKSAPQSKNPLSTLKTFFTDQSYDVVEFLSGTIRLIHTHH